MKTKLSETLKENGIAFTFPIQIKDANGKVTYYEDINGYWWKHVYDAKGEITYYENSSGYWRKREFNANGKITHYEDKSGYWNKREYDSNGNETYYENSDGIKMGTPKPQSCDGKVVEIDGKKYKLTEL